MNHQDMMKQCIANSTRELVRQNNFEHISVEEICTNAGVSRRTFYRYFKDKYEVLECIFDLDSLVPNDTEPEWTLLDYFPYLAKTFYSDRTFYNNAYKFVGQNSFREFSIAYLTPILTNDYGSAFSSQETLDIFIKYICNVTFDCFVLWLSEDPCMTPEEFISKYLGTYLKIINLMKTGIDESGLVKE